MTYCRYLAAAFAAALSMLCALPLQADSGLLEGQRIDFYVTGRPGDGYDTAARLIANHMEKILGSGTEVVVRNSVEGNGRIALQQIYSAPPDGLTVAMIQSGILLDQVLQEEASDFDLSRALWIGKITDSTRVLLAGPGAAYRDIQGLLAAAEPQTLSAYSPNASSTIEAYILNAVLGTKLRPVFGFDTASKPMSVLRGEVMTTNGTASSLLSLIENPDTTILLFTARGSAAATFGKAPALADLAPPESRRLIAFLDVIALYGRLMCLPPGVPPEVVQAWRETFEKVTTDPNFVAEALALQLEIAPLGGAEVQRAVDGFFADTAGLREEINRAVACGKARAEGSEVGC